LTRWFLTRVDVDTQYLLTKAAAIAGMPSINSFVLSAAIEKAKQVIEALNNYLKVMASQQAKKDTPRTFVLEDDNDHSHIIGFYTLTMTPITSMNAMDSKRFKTQKTNSLLPFLM
jgi:hypothetical protein